MVEPLWQFEYSVESDASPQFAWAYWTNIANWDDPPATFELEGSFGPGSRLITTIPGQEPRHSIIQEVGPDRTATIEMELPGATLRFDWRFDEVTGNRTRITQRLTLSGENAGAFVKDVASGFEPNVPQGMRKLAAAVARAEASSIDASETGNAASG
jgi:Polyketide cyclase / dehydrase and lipid transport